MISNLTIKHLSSDTYTMIVGGDEGEQELAISISTGQGGFSPLIAVAMSVDGGGSIRTHRAVLNHNLAGEIAKELKAWAHQGIRPSVEALSACHGQIAKIVGEIIRTWGLEFSNGDAIGA